MRKNYNVDWDAGLAAPMTERVPPALGGLRLDQALARLFPQYSRNRLQAWLKSGHITIDGRRLSANHAVSGGERVALQPPRVPDAALPQAQRMPLKVLFEDAALIVIDKPAGLVVHPGAGQPDRTLLNALLAHAPALAAVPRAGIVHRLDKDTSGLLVV
ncbi:MAG: pseudouridine synthase, partial [Burkholderiales bacterium]